MMNATEIKAAWNTYKKNSKKELSFYMTGCCSMTAKQIKNGTATMCLCAKVSYEEDIDNWKRQMEWRKKDRGEINETYYQCEIRRIEEQREKYGNREGEAAAKYDEIISSKAFRQLAESIGIKATTLEVQGYYYYLRINY